MELLRDPKTGCPWDIEQDFKSITTHTIEEAYEVVDAVDNNDFLGLKEELGDLLLQIIFYSQMAREEGYFTFDDVVCTINNKLIERHPHVFSDKIINTAKEQEVYWEKQKEKERKEKSNKIDVSVLDGIALALPALTRSVKIQKRAANVGFDWNNTDEVFKKIEEELQELKLAIIENSNIEEECGDLLFSISCLSTKLNLDPESALKSCNQKFITRFNYIENALAKENKKPEAKYLKLMEQLWNEAKAIKN